MTDIIATPRQIEYLQFIGDVIQANGIGPTMREILNHFHLVSVNGAAQTVRVLKRKGYLTTQPHKARTIKLTRKGWAAINVESTDATPGPAHEPGPLCPRCGGTGRL